VRVLILSDTHLRPGRMSLPAGVVDLLEGRTTGTRPDLILHAGDLIDPAVLPLLAEHAPVHAVLGNNDVQLWGRLPERLELELEGVKVAMVHDSGAREGRARRLRRWFPDARVVVFGHSHLPFDEAGEAGQWLFNPGSPTERRRAPTRTCGLLEVSEGAVVGLELVDLGR
jgi:putative phosphoesterase